MKEIKLTGSYAEGRTTMVDDEDYEILNKHKWYYNKGYAVRGTSKRKLLGMHQQLMKNEDIFLVVDHIDGNPLNNQKSNLRLATRKQNITNRRVKKDKKTSGYIGVHLWVKNDRKTNKIYKQWGASCQSSGKKHVVLCKTEIEAAIIYNEMAIKYHGEYTRLNDIPQDIVYNYYEEKEKEAAEIREGKKKCSTCKKYKHKYEYANDKSRADKLYPICKLCIKNKSKKRIQEM